VSSLILTVAGVGPGDPELVTIGALKAVARADIVLAPCSGSGKDSVAEKIIRAHLPKIKTVPFIFPMTSNDRKRNNLIREQLAGMSAKLKSAASVVLPVIGDSALYATGSYLFDIWKEIDSSAELRLIPGISAHSLAASRAASFLAMADQTLTVISGTAGREAVKKALLGTDVAAVYKPSALKNALSPVTQEAGPWKRIIRVDRAGLPGERITEGGEALAGVSEYLSILLLWR